MNKKLCAALFALAFVLTFFSAASGAPDTSAYVVRVTAENDDGVSESGTATLLVPRTGLYVTSLHIVEKVPNGRLSVHGTPVTLFGFSKTHNLQFFTGPVTDKQKELPALRLRLPLANDNLVAVGFTYDATQTIGRFQHKGKTLKVLDWILSTDIEGSPGFSGGPIFTQPTTEDAGAPQLSGITHAMPADRNGRFPKGKIYGANAQAVYVSLQLIREYGRGANIDIDSEYSKVALK